MRKIISHSKYVQFQNVTSRNSTQMQKCMLMPAKFLWSLSSWQNTIFQQLIKSNYFTHLNAIHSKWKLFMKFIRIAVEKYHRYGFGSSKLVMNESDRKDPSSTKCDWMIMDTGRV